MKAPPKTQQQGQAAFSLAELLLVVAIISILSVLSVYSVKGLLSSSSVTAAGQHLQEIVAEARQYAISRSRTVELRVYEQKGGTDFNGWQLVLYKPDLTVDQRVSKPQFLPAGVVISGDTANTSTLLGVNLPLQVEATDGSATSGLSYASVRFAPTGGLKDVTPSGTNYYLLVVPQKGTVTDLTAPNRVVLSVEPFSGVAQYCRP